MVVGVVLLAAGAGSRFGASRPKQFAPLKNGPLFLTSLRAFLSVPAVREVVVVSTPRHRGRIERSVKTIKTSKKIHYADGGAYRGLSVKNGVLMLSTAARVVLVHDSARPMVTKDIIERVIKASAKNGAALAAWPLPDTLKLASPASLVKKTIPRKNLWLAQTPQGFRRDVALTCLLRPSADATDDVELAERRGYKVALVEGSPTNFKVTYPTDLKLCRLLCR